MTQEFEADVVVFCTGYQLGLHFLAEELRVNTTKLYYPDGLFKGILSIKAGNNKLMFVGLQHNLLGHNLLEAQTIWACSLIMDQITLPSMREMSEEVVKMQESLEEATKDHDFPKRLEFMVTYFINSVEAAGHYKSVLEVLTFLYKLKEQREENIFTVRDLQFKSFVTGKVAPAPKVPYMDNFDDSLEAYVKQ